MDHLYWARDIYPFGCVQLDVEQYLFNCLRGVVFNHLAASHSNILLCNPKQLVQPNWSNHWCDTSYVSDCINQPWWQVQLNGNGGRYWILTFPAPADKYERIFVNLYWLKIVLAQLTQGSCPWELLLDWLLAIVHWLIDWLIDGCIHVLILDHKNG